MASPDRYRGGNPGDADAWFAPHRFGFGVRPVAWPGWALTIGYVAVVMAIDAALRRHHHGVEIALIAVLTAGYLVLAAQHTRGGLRWRWGDGE